MIEKLSKAWDWLVHDRSDLAMLLRTVLEAIGGYISANLIVLLNLFEMSTEARMFVMGLFTVLYSKILACVRQQRLREETKQE